MVRVPFDFIARGAVPVACIFGLSRLIPVSGVVFRESHPQSVFMVNEAALNVDRNPFRKLAQSYNNSVYRPLLVCFALFLVIVAISFLIFRLVTCSIASCAKRTNEQPRKRATSEDPHHYAATTDSGQLPERAHHDLATRFGICNSVFVFVAVVTWIHSMVVPPAHNNKVFIASSPLDPTMSAIDCSVPVSEKILLIIQYAKSTSIL